MTGAKHYVGSKGRIPGDFGVIFTLRIPEELKDALKTKAHAEGRSLSAYIRHTLQEKVDDTENARKQLAAGQAQAAQKNAGTVRT